MNELALEHEGCTVTKTDELKAMLRARFCAPEWALFFEVYASTGWAAGGRADAVAMNLYPSRGLTVNGMEFKVSRADWLRELRDGSKAETIFGYCDHWWLVVGDRAIVKANELPEPWGLIAPRKKDTGSELAIVKQAPKLSPKPLDKEFIACLARRAHIAMKEEMQPMLDAATDAARKEARAMNERDLKYLEGKQAELEEQVAEFEKASGIRITEYCDGKALGEAVALIRRGGLGEHADTFRWMLERAGRLHEELKAVEPLLPPKEKR